MSLCQKNRTEHGYTSCWLVVNSFSFLPVSLSGDLPQHLQVMFKVLRSEDRIKLVSITNIYFHYLIPQVLILLLILGKKYFIADQSVWSQIAGVSSECCHNFWVKWCKRSTACVPQAVRLESGWSERVRYMVVIYTNGHQDTEENIVLGMDFTDKDR